MRSVVLPVLALVLGACAGTHTHHAPAAEAEGEMQMPQPTAEHQMLVQGVGTWEGQLTHFMPGQPPMSAPCKEVVEAIGGFWTQSHFSCDFMGMPFNGSASMGYSTEKEKFVGTWIDSFSDYLSIMEGTMDESGHQMTMRFEAPNMEGVITPHRIETTFNPDSYISTFYMGKGEGTKSMVIEMKRKG